MLLNNIFKLIHKIEQEVRMKWAEIKTGEKKFSTDICDTQASRWKWS